MKCNDIANAKVKELKLKVDRMVIKPKLNIIQVGDRADSNSYIKNKIRYCNRIGIWTEVLKLDENISNRELLDFVRLKARTEFVPCFVQLPLPDHIDTRKVLELIRPEKDVDGFTYENMGKLLCGEGDLVPCTPKGIMTVLKYVKGKDLQGSNVLVINRSNIVGKPLSMMLLDEDCTVTIAHSKTKNLQELINSSDIIVTAIGKANYFGVDNFKPGQVVIDVSINRNENGLCGDIKKSDYDALERKGVLFTEVPNGIGVMTVISLMEQIVKVYARHNYME